MNKSLLVVIIVISVIINLFLLKQNLTLRNAEAATSISQEDNCLFPDSSYIVDAGGGVKADVRGLYSIPGTGRFMLQPREDAPSKTHFSLVVFLAAKTVGDKDNCPPCLFEFDNFKRLDSLFKTRNQKLLFAVERPDSSAVADYIKKVDMKNELLVLAPDSGLSLYQMGISYRSMPFKIVFDSSFNPIYMRGANSTKGTQLEFENAVKFLSDVDVGLYRKE